METGDCLFIAVTVPKAVLEGRAGRVPVYSGRLLASPGATARTLPSLKINLYDTNGYDTNEVTGSMAVATQRVRKKTNFGEPRHAPSATSPNGLRAT